MSSSATKSILSLALFFFAFTTTKSQFTLSCESNSDCHIDCSTQSCINYNIDASQAISLTLDCNSVNGSGCKNASIKCPAGDSTSCYINCIDENACKYTSIETATNNRMDNFMLSCNDMYDNSTSNSIYSCHYVSLVIQSTYIENVTIHCNGEWSCLSALIFIESTMNTFEFSCDGQISCSDLDIYIPSDSIESFSWNCGGWSSCDSTEMIFANDTEINSFSLKCSDYRSCRDLVVNTSTINTLNIDCTNTLSCRYLHFDVPIGHKATIDCSSSASCDVHIELESISSDVVVDINCENSNITESYIYAYDGACPSSKFYLYGYIDEHNDKHNNISIKCGRLDCIGIRLDAYDVHEIHTECAENSCQYMNIYGESADVLNLYCDGQWGCKNTWVYCPYHNVNVCNINCSHYRACEDIVIQVPDVYADNYIQSICASGCDINVGCIDSDKSSILLSLDNIENAMRCDHSTASYCCPYTTNTITCITDTNCTVNCNINSTDHCKAGIIDGTLANYLIVNCNGTYACKDTLIYCPKNGCAITCDHMNNATYSCARTEILYDGEIADNGTVDIRCYESVFFDQYSESIDSHTCLETVINVEHVDVINIECLSMEYWYWEKGCENMVLNAQNANEVYIDVQGPKACVDATFFMQNATSITVNVVGEESLVSCDLHGETADVFIASCTGDEACGYNYWYIPYNATFNCYGKGCYRLKNLKSGPISNTSVSYISGLQINLKTCYECTDVNDCIQQLYLHCNYSLRHTTYGSYYTYNNYQEFQSTDVDECSVETYGNQCNCTELFEKILMDFSDSYSDECYSVQQPVVCESGTHCNVVCSDHLCKNQVIDGGWVDFLTVTCDGKYECANSIIKCPLIGCNITCIGPQACESTIIYATDTENIALNCLQVLPEITLANWLSYSIDNQTVCDSVRLYAENANNVQIYGYEAVASTSSMFYVNNAKSVVIYSYGAEAIGDGFVYAENAQSLTVTCVSGPYNGWSCGNNYWYLPRNSTFNCYGNGCNSLSRLHNSHLNSSDPLDGSSMDINVNGCDSCNDITECITDFELFCGYDGDYYRESQVYSSYSESDEDCNVNNPIDVCGCSDVIENIEYRNDADDKCYSVLVFETSKMSTTVATTEDDKDQSVSLKSVMSFIVSFYLCMLCVN